jgi:hypothetical protein
LYLKIPLLLSSQKPFRIYFYTSFSKDNKPIYSNIVDNQSLTNQEIFNYYYMHTIITKVYIGNPKNYFNIELSFSSKRTWICGGESQSSENNFFFSSKSTSFKKINGPEKIMTSQGIKTGNYSKDIIKIGNNSIHNEYFNFYLIEECNDNDYGELGIGIDNYFSSNFSHLSIIEQLKQKKLIGSSIISVRYINNTFGEILLGVNDDNYKKKFLDFNIPSIDNSIVKSPFIQSMYILKQITNVNDKSEEETVFEKKINIQLFIKLRIEIDFGSSLISVPEEVFDDLIESSFGKYIHNKKLCEIKIDINRNIKYFICDNKILNTNLDKLVIVIDSEKKLVINLDNMFLPLNNKKQILFGIISEKNINYIYIGEIFLKNYVIHLNSEKKTIQFYNKDILKEQNEEKIGFILIIFIGICLTSAMYYMLSITCERKNVQMESNSNVEKFLRKNYVKKKHKKLKRYKRFMQ